jgi:polysaccharide pyruvyl transferase CsaB
MAIVPDLLATATIRTVERVLLLGYFGAGNFGDDALLVCWLIKHYEWLLRNGLVADITCAGDADPVAGFTESEVLGEIVGKAIPKRQVLGVPTFYYQALIAPGGSLLQDTTSVGSLLYYLWVIRRFLRDKKPVYLLNQGIGPLSSWLADFLTPRYLAGVRMLSVRDAESYAWAQRDRRLAKHPELHLACDPMLKPPFRSVPEVETLPALRHPYALILPKLTGDLPYHGDATTEAQALARLVEHVGCTTGLAPVLLPLHRAQDAKLCADVQKEYADCTVLDLSGFEAQHNSAVLTAIGGAELVVSYRLHGMVTAAACGIPALGVAYDPKVSVFCNEVGFPYCFPATVHGEAAFNDLGRLWRDRRDVVALLGERREKMLSRHAAAEERFHALW